MEGQECCANPAGSSLCGREAHKGMTLLPRAHYHVLWPSLRLSPRKQERTKVSSAGDADLPLRQALLQKASPVCPPLAQQLGGRGGAAAGLASEAAAGTAGV